ncbi:hypothetical protein BTJ40_10860 [Microbulbifer sp. A4B17]|uniref:energy transducer TonB n=1 Tax=Microbulbifer sp. A4B17 TaxID=359370 RepID=UPI000D52D8CD|nr:energy transducer TonB [Microbulbifer sp. A4B17]AWF81278.1 hypothetical protein BTJ40_10860 [Microbulbifer sp. A4B17]
MRLLFLIFSASFISACASNTVSFRGCESYEQCPEMLYSLKASEDSREAAKQKGEPIPLTTTPPIYPVEAFEEKLEGYVIVEFNVDMDGQVIDPKVQESTPAGVFDESALAAVMHTRYEPSDSQYQGYSMKYNFKYPEENRAKNDKVVCRTERVVGSMLKKAEVCVDKREPNPLIERIQSGSNY